MALEILKRWRRRDLLRAGLAGAVLEGLLSRRARAAEPYTPEAPAHPLHSAYGGDFEPPPELTANALDALTYPPPAEPVQSGRVREVDLWANEQRLQVARDVEFAAWTYNGSVPGPVIRAGQGERLRIHFRNFGHHPHNVHFHGRHDVSQDGWQPVAAGGRETYEFVAEPHGLHPYHCHALPVSQHIARGLYGCLLVDPAEPRPPAFEVVLVLCGFDLDGDGRNEVYAWNGVAGFFARFPIKVPVGALVRVYLTNMVSGDPVASFHLHAETFDLYRSGTRLAPDEHTDVVSLAQSERAVIEFRLPRRGRYMFHPHQVWMAERGAMGWFAAV